MSVFTAQWLAAHWSQIGLIVSEILGLFGVGGVVKGLIDVAFTGKRQLAVQPAAAAQN